MALPDFLVDRYRDWKNNKFPKKLQSYKLAEAQGQKPKAMIISCCDSRVHATKILRGDIGDFFIHRNIANLIPPFSKDVEYSETLSSIEYGVQHLNISNIILLGHSNCGGINYAHQLLSNNAKDENFFINNWVKNIAPAYLELDHNLSKDNQIKSLEKLSIINSISNLNKFPIINKNKINIYGLWFEISSGKLMYYDSNNKKFQNINY